MIFGKKALFSILLGCDFLTNILEITHSNFIYTTTLLSFCTCLLLPGLLISFILRIRMLSLWENLLFIIGLGIAFLEFGGLFLNIFLPLFGVNDPLAFQNLLIGFNIYVLLLFIIAWIRTQQFAVKITKQAYLMMETSLAGNGAPGLLVSNAPAEVIETEDAIKNSESGLLVSDTHDKVVEDEDVTENALKAVYAEEIEDEDEDVTENALKAVHVEGIEDEDEVASDEVVEDEYAEAVEDEAVTEGAVEVVRVGEVEDEAETEDVPGPGLILLQLPRRSKIEKVLFTLPVFFPILATLGAIMLNNGGSNLLTLILLGSIAFYSLLLVLLREKITVDLYPYAIFFIGIASLFTTSLRSWYITGHDVEREFYVFQLTNTHHIWNMAFSQDAYNACLSITILPTVLTNLLLLPDMYVYKVIFQILFATSPVLVFFILKRYTTPIVAFLSAFFFMSFPTFFNDMAMLNRQEIGFIFFGLVLYMVLLTDLSLWVRRSLFILFALSVIVSHYSTNFVLLALVAFVYVFTLILSWPFVKKIFASLLSISHIKIKNAFPQNAFLRLPLVVLLFAMTYLWNTVYTNSSSHTGSVIAEIVSGIFVKSNDSGGSNDLSYSLFSSVKLDPKQELQSYIQSILSSETVGSSAKADSSQFYSKSITSKYPVVLMDQEQLAPTPFGNWLSSFHMPIFTIQAELRSLSASFMQIFVFIGLFAIFFLRNKKPFDLQYLLLCFGAVFLLALIIVLPALSVEYGLLRMFQQMLFLLSLPIVLGVNSIFFFVKEQKRILLTAIIAIVFFLNLTGFISHLTGDYYPQLTLDNAGLYYDAYYVHTSDVLAIAWLSKNNSNDAPVAADFPGVNKILGYGDMDALKGFFPEVIQKQAYVYLEVSSQRAISIDADTLFFTSPERFLHDNKNIIYSNGKDNIYK